MTTRLHKNAFRQWRDQNQDNGSPVGAAILGYLTDEPESHPLRDTPHQIPRVPLPAPKQKDQ